MSQPQQGQALVQEIATAEALEPRLWWLGQYGFAIKHHQMVFLVDPLLTGNPVLGGAPLSDVDLVLATRVDSAHFDASGVGAILQASRRTKVVLPRQVSEDAHKAGIPYQRMTTTDSGLRVEYFKTGAYARVYAVPADTPGALSYIIRFGNITFYHAGRSRPYEGLENQLRPYDVSVALLPLDLEHGYSPAEACNLAAAIGARWLVPMRHEGAAQEFMNYLLFHRPEQRFKVFTPGEGWQISESLPE